MSQPRLSVIVIVHAMSRQAMNTLRSLLPPYQEGVRAEDYEVVVLENRSGDMLDPAQIATLPGQVRHVVREEPGVSPAPAINEGLALARGRTVGLMIDGARLVSPGVLRLALMAARAEPGAVTAVPGYQIGARAHHLDGGSDFERDRALMEGIGWPESGYRIFEIASMSEANRIGVFLPFIESNCIFAPAAMLAQIGGADERFDLPGGGALNLWLYHKLVNHPEAVFFVLPGEGSFHQAHGGVTTSAKPAREALIERIRLQLEEVIGGHFESPKVEPILLGRLPLHAHQFLDYSVQKFTKRARRLTKSGAAPKGVTPEAPQPRTPRRAASPQAGAQEPDMTLYLPPSLRGFAPRRNVFSTWTPHLPFAYDLVAAVRPRLLVELGTQAGQSYFTFCQSMKEAGVDGTAYAVDTFRGDAHTGPDDASLFEDVSAHNSANYAGFSYLMQMLFEEAAEHFSEETISLLHIDGLHTYEAVQGDFELWYPKVAPGGIVLFHDIRARIMDFGVWKLWEELEMRAGSEGWQTFAFDQGFGLGVLRKPGGERSEDAPLMRMLFEPKDGGADLRAFYAHAAQHVKLRRKEADRKTRAGQRKKEKNRA